MGTLRHVLLPLFVHQLWQRCATHCAVLQSNSVNNKSSCRSQQLLGTVYGVGFDCRTGKLQSFEGHKEGIWNKVNLTTHIKWKRREMPQPYKNIQRNNLRAVWTIFSGISSHRMDSWSNPEISQCGKICKKIFYMLIYFSLLVFFLFVHCYQKKLCLTLQHGLLSSSDAQL